MAVKNSSSGATTIKAMYELMPSDKWTLDKCLLYCNYDNAAVVQCDLLLDKYYSYFEQYLIEIDVDEKYYYQPALFANDYYGDPELDFLVLYFANMTSLFDFTKPKIKVLNYAYLQDINKLFTNYKTVVEDNKKNPPLYSSSSVSATKTHAKYIQE